MRFTGVPGWDPLGSTAPAELVESYSPLGVTLRLETNSRDILEACRASFGAYGTSSGSRAQRSRFTIRLLVDSSFTEGPPWPAVIFRRQEEMIYASAGSQNTMVADLRRRQAFGFVSRALAEDSDFLRHNFLDCLTLTMMTRGSGATHTYVHASAVAKGNKGLILCGPRESGKSTLAYACARRDFNIVADDVVYLRGGRSLTAWGRPWRLRLLPDSARFFPELSQEAERSRSIGRQVVEIDVQKFLPGRAQVRCVPMALFFLQRTAARTACDRLGLDEALGLLARDMVYDPPEVIAKHNLAWTALAERGTFALRWGEAPDAAVDLLERFLDA